ncbi:MAG: glycoside hydrolase family 9 protein [bacterium]|nr:glycoside hydrolase family 9 protein [bacterium]
MKAGYPRKCRLLAAVFAVAASLAIAADREPFLQLNGRDYFETAGFNVLVFENQYDGMFFDEKKAGILLVHHGVRTATGGAVRLNPAPEQWDPIPAVVERKVDRPGQAIEVLLRYQEYDFDSRVTVRPEGGGFRVQVTLDRPLPEILEGRAGFNLEFLPSAYFGKTYAMDGRIGLFPLHPADSMDVRPMADRMRQFAGHSTFDDRGRSEYVEPRPIASGRTLMLAPEDPERRIRIASADRDLALIDGRNVAQNGWFVVRSLIPAKRTGIVLEWTVTPHLIPNWIRPPMIAHSQAGYLPGAKKTAVIELDPRDKPLSGASLLKLNDRGEWTEVFRDDAKNWGAYLRYRYLQFDFSGVTDAGLYAVRYGKTTTGPFPIGGDVYDRAWQPTLDVWFPVQMSHMTVNEAYRVWHGAAHLDDARQAPVNHQHFDGYRMGDSTETRYKPGERIPGLAVGGWFDAGDFDIRTGSHAAAVQHFVDLWERHRPERDQTFIDQDRRYVDIHRPDGTPDVLQQIEQGALALIAQHRAFGRAIPGIIVPFLHQYHHLGDASTMTDNRIYDPSLKPGEVRGDFSGTPDDRWAFTSKSSHSNYASAAALAAASRALRGFNDALASECLAAAKKAWEEERRGPAQESRAGNGFAGGGEMEAALQIAIASRDTAVGRRFRELLWPSLDRGLQSGMRTAARALPFMDAAFRERLKPYVEAYRGLNNALLNENPFGVAISTRGWAGNSGIISWAVTNALLHQAYPELIGPETVTRGLDYLFGCHPYSNVSFVAAVGVKPKRIMYGNNRADFGFIAGAVVPGILVLKPDFPEHMDDWPFLWGENEAVIDICAEYILLVNEALKLGGK